MSCISWIIFASLSGIIIMYCISFKSILLELIMLFMENWHATQKSFDQKEFITHELTLSCYSCRLSVVVLSVIFCHFLPFLFAYFDNLAHICIFCWCVAIASCSVIIVGLLIRKRLCIRSYFLGRVKVVIYLRVKISRTEKNISDHL